MSNMPNSNHPADARVQIARSRYMKILSVVSAAFLLTELSLIPGSVRAESRRKNAPSCSGNSSQLGAPDGRRSYRRFTVIQCRRSSRLPRGYRRGRRPP